MTDLIDISKTRHSALDFAKTPVAACERPASLSDKRKLGKTRFLNQVTSPDPTDSAEEHI